MGKTTLAVIIARAGSKGLARKNLRVLADKPLVAWTIEHALGSRSIGQIALTSDSPQILQIARGYGIAAYERPPELAADDTTVDGAARHGAECWSRDDGRVCDHVAIMYGNVAVRPVDLTDRAVAKLVETGADSVQSVCPVGKTHPLWMRRLGGEDGDVLREYEPNRIYRRQDLPPLFMIDAGVLVVRWPALFQVDEKEPHAFLGADRRAITTNEGEVIDIDTEMDLRLAEITLAERAAQPRPASQKADHAA